MKTKTIICNFLTALIVGIFPATSFAAPQIGQAAPDFSLTDIQGATQTLSQYKGKTVVLEWTNPDCPFVKKHYESNNMQKLQKTYTDKGVIWLSVNSSASGKQGNYSPEEWQAIVKSQEATPTALLLDPDGKVGKLYEAKTTPHMFVINPEGTLVYMGAIDSKSGVDSKEIQTADNYVAQALDKTLEGQPVETSSTTPYGCGVKY